MSRMLGTVSCGLRAPIIRDGEDLAQIVVDCVMQAVNNGELSVRNRDIVAVTESIVARTQGNYVTVEDIAADVYQKFGGETVGVIFPILSRNRFSVCLKGIAKGCKKIVMMLSYPGDEVGNNLVSPERLYRSGINPYSDVLDIKQYREAFGYEKHPFTGMDYVEFYEQLIRESGAEVEFVFANDPLVILRYTKVTSIPVSTPSRC